MMPEENQQAVAEFRTTRGELGGGFEDTRVIVLTTTDFVSGMKVVQPVGFHYDKGGRLLIIAVPSDDGTLPEWHANVLATPRVLVETGTSVMDADAQFLAGQERDTVYARVAEATPALGEKQKLMDAPIPIVALHPRSRARIGAGSWGDELKAAHDGLRRELALIRKEIASAGPRLAPQLRINCLTACGMLRRHHVSEDDEMFPLIDRRHPELASMVARLREQHREVQDLLNRLQEVISHETTGSALALTEVDRLASAIEAHLDYEEEQLVAVLNSLKTT